MSYEVIKAPEEEVAILTEDRRVLMEALVEACAAISAGMVIATKVPGANDTLTVLQTAFAVARAALEKVSK